MGKAFQVYTNLLIAIKFLITFKLIETGTYKFGTSESPLVHNVVSLFPEKCQIFVIANYPLRSENLNVNYIAIIQYATLDVDGKNFSYAERTVKSGSCKIAVLNLKMTKHKNQKDPELWWTTHFQPADKVQLEDLSSWSNLYLQLFRLSRPSFVLSLIPISFNNPHKHKYLKSKYPCTLPFSQHDEIVFLSLPKKLQT